MGRQKQQPLEHRLLLTATFCLLAGGAVMVYSASSARTLLQGQGDGTSYLVKYVTYGAIGLVGMYLVSRLNLELIRRYTGALLIASFVMLVMVKVPGVGVRVNGAHRWLGFGPLQFQPSEIMKIALVLHISAVIANRPKIARSIRTLTGPVIGVAGAAVLLIALQPDLGTDLVICATVGTMMIAAGLPMRQLGLAAGVGASLVMLFAIFEPYRRARLTRFLDPWDHAVRRGLPGGAGADRDRLGRPVRPRARRVDPEDLLRSRGPHRLHPRRDRRGARPGGHPGAAVAVRHHRVRRAADRPQRRRASTPSSSPAA